MRAFTREDGDATRRRGERPCTLRRYRGMGFAKSLGSCPIDPPLCRGSGLCSLPHVAKRRRRAISRVRGIRTHHLSRSELTDAARGAERRPLAGRLARLSRSTRSPCRRSALAPGRRWRNCRKRFGCEPMARRCAAADQISRAVRARFSLRTRRRGPDSAPQRRSPSRRRPAPRADSVKGPAAYSTRRSSSIHAAGSRRGPRACADGP